MAFMVIIMPRHDHHGLYGRHDLCHDRCMIIMAFVMVVMAMRLYGRHGHARRRCGT